MTGTYCDFSVGEAAGTCVTSLPAEGSTCDPTLDLACNQLTDYCDTTSLKCTAFIAPGSACPAGSQCVPWATCASNGMCVEKGVLNAPCSNQGECMGDLECGTAGTCIAATPPAICTM